MKGIRPNNFSCLIILFLATGPIFAAGVLPGSVAPEQVSRAVQETQPIAAATPLPVIQEVESKAKGPLIGEAAGRMRFQLNGVTLIGNHVYSEEALQHLWKSKIGKSITILEFYNIVQDITNYYRNNGYILSRAIVPPQRVKNGHVKIQVIEGFISDVKVVGHPHRACGLVQRMGNQIKICKPLEISRMEGYLYLMNEIPGTTVRAVVTASENVTGAADLSLATETRPITGYLSYDNYGTRYIGPQESGGHLSLNSVVTSGDSFGMTYTTVPKDVAPRELIYYDVNYSLPLNLEGTRLLLGATPVTTNPAFLLKDLEIHGVTENYYATVTIPIIRKREEQLTTRIGFVYLDSNVEILKQKLYTDHIRPLDIGATYYFRDRWQALNTVTIDIYQGLPIMGYSQDTNINTAQTSRPGGHANFTKFNLSIERIQNIKGNLSLYWLLEGQLSAEALLIAEQFAFGGNIIGRGYDPAELLGDEGLAGSVELRYNWAPQKRFFQSIQFYIFYDAGMINDFIQINNLPRHISATSTGFGGRFNLTTWLSGNVFWAQPLTKIVNAEALANRGKEPRVFFSLLASF